MSQKSLTPEQRGRLMRLATYASTAVAVTLILCKLTAWIMTGSVSMLATLVDSCLDAVASLINLFAVRHALQPADREHRFGHGKAEPLAGLGQSMFIIGSAVFVLFEAVNRLFHPVQYGQMSVGIGVMILSMVLTGGLLLFQRYVVRKTGSTAILADSLHYGTDLLINASVIIALLLTAQGILYLDAIFGVGIAIYIFISAREIALTSIHILMDRELPASERDRIKQIVRSHPQVRGIHDLRTRSSGAAVFIQLHLELDGSLPLAQAHDIGDEVEALLKQQFPEAEVIIHADPEGLFEQRTRFA